jgi:hypothetical protein
MITWNTKQIPGIIGEIENEDGQTIPIHTDWDYPGVAGTFGWSTERVQKCPSCHQLVNPGDLMCQNCYLKLTDFPDPLCRHPTTDGTIACVDCGVTASQFIQAAGEYLRDHDGVTAEDPGYFCQSKCVVVE